VHRQIRDECVRQLQELGAFSIRSVLHETRLSMMEASIRFDYLRDDIEREHHWELIPVSSAYFAPRRPDMLEHHPERFLSLGRGKRVFGYARVDQMNASLATCWLIQKRAVATGTFNSYTGFAGAMDAEAILPKQYEPLSLQEPLWPSAHLE
jgi:hypothetical protein